MWRGALCAFSAFVIFFGDVVAEMPKFRILAPEIVCPKDENSVIDKPDNTIVTLQTEDLNLKVSWLVRWVPLDAPTQRFVLMLWRSVVLLEAQLNGPQPEDLVYVINNTDLLKGVDYVFNVTTVEEHPTTKTFHIDNISGDQKLIVDGRADKFSVFLVGGDKVYVDMEYVLEADVTTCSPHSDYYFRWLLKSSTGEATNITDLRGHKFTIPPYTLEPGATYYVFCQIYNNASDLVTQTVFPFQTLFRGLKVYLSFDSLYVSGNTSFTMNAFVDNRDYYYLDPTFKWGCLRAEHACEGFVTVNDDTMELTEGLPDEGEYTITVEVNILDQQATANATVYIVDGTLPVIQIQPISRQLNVNSSITLVANASNVSPSCSLTWYFATEEYLMSVTGNESCVDECSHGTPLTDTITVHSLEENFLAELSDFSNGTEWRQVSVELVAGDGRARFVARCGCSLTFSCEAAGEVYADVRVGVNVPPVVGEFKISPETGTAMETVFHISKPTALDENSPLLYSLWCGLGSDSMVIASNLQYLTVDIFLPYVDDQGTPIWIEVCDSFGACSSTTMQHIMVTPGEGRTVSELMWSVRGSVLRCEVMMLRSIVEGAVVTYINAGQKDTLSAFTENLLITLPSKDAEHCLNNNEDYQSFLTWLDLHDIHVT